MFKNAYLLFIPSNMYEKYNFGFSLQFARYKNGIRFNLFYLAAL